MSRVEPAHSHARGISTIYRVADDAFGDVRARAVVLKPVGKILHLGRAGRNFDPGVSIADLDHTVAVAVGPDVVSRDPEIVYRQGVLREAVVNRQIDGLSRG